MRRTKLDYIVYFLLLSTAVMGTLNIAHIIDISMWIVFSPVLLVLAILQILVLFICYLIFWRGSKRRAN